MNLDTRSTPFRTPAKIIASVKRANTRKQISVEVPSEIKAEKYPSSASFWLLPFTYSMRYLITHPPITE